MRRSVSEVPIQVGSQMSYTITGISSRWKALKTDRGEDAGRFKRRARSALWRSLGRRLSTAEVGRKVVHFSEISSTMDAALEVALENRQAVLLRSSAGVSGEGRPAPLIGTAIFADYQSGGRGRLDRTWVSPPRKSLLFSVILEPFGFSTALSVFPLMTAVSLCSALETFLGVAPEIKWPNDLTLSGKKFCGVLCRAQAFLNGPDEGEGTARQIVVLGIGVNLNQRPADFPPEIRDTATSLRIVLGKRIPRIALARRILERIDADYQEILREGAQPLLRRYKARCASLGRHVRVILPNEKVIGWAEDIAEDGSLVLRVGEGCRVLVRAGDVVHLR